MTAPATPAPPTAQPLTEADRRRAEALPTTVLLLALTGIAPLSVDMVLPSMPTMADEFRASESTLQLAVTLFIISFATSQLFYGPASDRYGRRPLLLAGLALFIVGGLIALSASSAPVLIAGRVLQGLGGGAGPALARAIVLDIYGRERAARVMAYMAIALPLAPAIAPVIGGFLHDAFGWHSVFVTLAGLGVLLAAGCGVLLPETNRQHEGGRGPSRLLANYREALSSRTFIAYVVVMGLMFSAQLVFISSSSFVLIDELGLGPQVFGFSFGFVALGIMAGATVSSRLVGRRPIPRIVLAGALTSTGGGRVMASLAWAGQANAATVLLPMFVSAMGLGITSPSAQAGALVPFPHMAGLASAVLGFSQMVIASTYNITYGALFEPSSRALGTGVFLAAAASLVAVLLLRPGVERLRSTPG